MSVFESKATYASEDLCLKFNGRVKRAEATRVENEFRPNRL